MKFGLTNKTVIVVGGAANIDAPVCKSISDNGGTSTTFDNFSSGHEHNN